MNKIFTLWISQEMAALLLLEVVIEQSVCGISSKVKILSP
jgi:hypothetical protein